MDTAANLLNIVLWIILSIFVIVYIINDKRFIGFIKGLFIVCFSLRLLTVLGIDLLSNTLELWKWYLSDFSDIIVFLSSFSYFLMFFCISLLIGLKNENSEPEFKTFNSKKRSIGLSLFLFIITAGIYFPFWLYRTVKDLSENFDEIPFTPAQAVGYLFIPVFNIYWLIKIIVTLPLKIKQIESNYYGNDPHFQFHPVFIIILWFLFIT